MRTCGGDGTSLEGVWGGVVPICSGKLLLMLKQLHDLLSEHLYLYLVM